MKKNIGILLTNIGTPDDPSVKSVRKYLKEFLSDPRVVKFPRLLWWFILRGFILTTRPKRSAHAYQKIWTQEGSPLLIITKNQTKKLQHYLNSDTDVNFVTALGMRYGSSSIATGLTELKKADCNKIVILPLYPQHSASTTASTFDAVAKAFRNEQALPECYFISDYHQDENYITALAQQIKTYWQEQGRAKHLLLSFHGIPKEFVLAGDPYAQQCHRTAELLIAQLNLLADEWSIAFQSRLGPKEWLKPYCNELLQELPQRGVKEIDVFCPGFAADCLETLEEISLQNRDLFLQAGGEKFRYIPALNDSELHIKALGQMIKTKINGWLS